MLSPKRLKPAYCILEAYSPVGTESLFILFLTTAFALSTRRGGGGDCSRPDSDAFFVLAATPWGRVTELGPAVRFFEWLCAGHRQSLRPSCAGTPHGRQVRESYSRSGRNPGIPSAGPLQREGYCRQNRFSSSAQPGVVPRRGAPSPNPSPAVGGFSDAGNPRIEIPVGGT
ncbi:hypothetical protein B0H14DRAFT_1318861 [Mycena olivaceomarginata]|nr:hypothetical protein B0H14DRAFT_1318861 [Mycena olivaceomarginata]